MCNFLRKNNTFKRFSVNLYFWNPIKSMAQKKLHTGYNVVSAFDSYCDRYQLAIWIFATKIDNWIWQQQFDSIKLAKNIKLSE